MINIVSESCNIVIKEVHDVAAIEGLEEHVCEAANVREEKPRVLISLC